MRLFTAIEFPEEIKALLCSDTEKIKKRFEYGRFVKEDTYHLTLVFLGETEAKRVKDIAAAMDRCAFPQMEMSAGALGCFRRDGGDVIWRRVDAPKDIFALQKTLEKELSEGGFKLESRRFTPHLTLARDAKLLEGETLPLISKELSEIRFTADKMTLFRSDIINGRRVYTPLHRTRLKNA